MKIFHDIVILSQLVFSFHTLTFSKFIINCTTRKSMAIAHYNTLGIFVVHKSIFKDIEKKSQFSKANKSKDSYYAIIFKRSKKLIKPININLKELPLFLKVLENALFC